MRRRKEKQAVKKPRRDFIIGSGSVVIGSDTIPAESALHRLLNTESLTVRLSTPAAPRR